ncbi:MAG: hypothetical protein IPP74_06750 [Alphaproteobacteria bacterium]|nr:hypothetical protein [Alphaproteobacteria bacterium]
MARQKTGTAVELTEPVNAFDLDINHAQLQYIDILTKQVDLSWRQIKQYDPSYTQATIYTEPPVTPVTHDAQIEQLTAKRDAYKTRLEALRAQEEAQEEAHERHGGFTTRILDSLSRRADRCGIQ